MPTYQYACTSCGERLEVVQKFSDDPLTECPACAGTLRKVFSPVGVVFKGSGFYKTDSRTTTGAKKASESSKEPAGAEKSTSSGSDSSGAKTSSTPSESSSSSAKPAASGQVA